MNQPQKTTSQARADLAAKMNQPQKTTSQAAQARAALAAKMNQNQETTSQPGYKAPLRREDSQAAQARAAFLNKVQAQATVTTGEQTSFSSAKAAAAKFGVNLSSQTRDELAIWLEGNVKGGIALAILYLAFISKGIELNDAGVTLQKSRSTATMVFLKEQQKELVPDFTWEEFKQKFDALKDDESFLSFLGRTLNGKQL